MNMSQTGTPSVGTGRVTVRRAQERGSTEIGWLHGRHTFSFNSYYDPAHMHFRSLRVINEDLVEPGEGFGTHGHQDMEIITIVLEGVLTHRDSLGHVKELKVGEVQTMSAGRGIRHSEYNAAAERRVHLLQIWIEPDERGLPPSYRQQAFDIGERQGRFQRVAGPAATAGVADGALLIHQDAHVLLGRVVAGQEITYPLRPGRAAWVHVATGQVKVNGLELEAGDAVAVEDAAAVQVVGGTGESEVLLFDLA